MNDNMSWMAPFDVTTFFEAGANRVLPDFGAPEGEIHLNLGAGHKRIAGSIPLDLPDWDSDENDIPFSDESVSVIHAYHILEHVGDPIRLLRECQRVLIPGGTLNIVVPYFRSQGAYDDLDHRHFFTEETWRTQFSSPYYDKGHDGWKFRIGLNIIMALNERNLMLFTQLIKET